MPCAVAESCAPRPDRIRSDVRLRRKGPMNQRIRQRPWPRLAVEAFGLLPAGLAIYTLAGWYRGLPGFLNPAPNAVPMAPSTALLFLALGGGVFLRAWRPNAERIRRLSIAAAALAILMGLALAVTSANGVFLDIEHPGLSIEGRPTGIPLGHMSPLTALLLAVSGLSLATSLPSLAGRWVEASTRWLASVAVVAGFVLVLMYAWDVAPLYSVLLVPPAAPTSVAILSLGLGLFGTWTLRSVAAKPEQRPLETMFPTYLLSMLTFAVGSIMIGTLAYRAHVGQYRVEIDREMAAIGDLKVAELVDWRQGQMGNASTLRDNGAFSALAQRYLQDPRDGEARQAIAQWLTGYLAAYGYDRVSLLDASAVERMSLPSDGEPLSPYLVSQAAAAIGSGQASLVDFYRDNPGEPAHMGLVIPILDGGRPLGTLAFRIDPSVYLYPFLAGWPTNSRTAETLVVRREGDEVVFLNELRFQQGAALNLRLALAQQTSPASAAVRGVTGIMEGLDYRGVPVIAYLSPVEDSPWFLVARIDRQEVYEPLRDRLLETVVVVGALLFGAAAGFGMMWRQERLMQYRAEAALGESEHRLQTTMDSMLEGAQLIGFDWRYLYVNDALAVQGKKAKDELLGRTMMEAYPGIDQTDFFVTLRRCMEKRVTERLENEFVFPDGSTGVFDLSLQPMPEGVFILSSDITERKRAEAAAYRHTEQVEALNRVARIVSGSLELDEVYDGFVAELRRLMPVDRTSITRIDEARENWTIVRQWTTVEPTLQPGGWHPLEKSVFGEVVRTGQPLVESPIDQDGRWVESPLLRDEGMQSRIIVPLMVKDRVTGTVSVAARSLHAFSEADLEMVVPLAAQLALAVENVRLYEKEREYAALLEQRVTERTAELEDANRELEAFSYSVSHDLRAPLRAVDGFSRILLEDHAASLDGDARRYLDLVRGGTQQMGRLIDDLLAFSRLSRQDLGRRIIQPTTLARQALEQLEADQAGRSLEIVIDDMPEASADPSLVRQVYVNLLSNALKFTRARSPAHIQVGSLHQNGTPVYFVRDDGVGFDMAYVGKLFGVFQRLHRSEEYEGTGVGLAIVQRVVHRHGGRVWAEGAVDQGATVFFTLPEGSES